MQHVMKLTVLYEEERRCPLTKKGYPKFRMRCPEREVVLSSKSMEEDSDDDRCCKKWDLDESKRAQDLRERLLYEIHELHVRQHKERRDYDRQPRRMLL